MSRFSGLLPRALASPPGFALAVGGALAAAVLAVGLALAVGLLREPQAPQPLPSISAISLPGTQAPPTAGATGTPEETFRPERSRAASPTAGPTLAPTPQPMGTPTGIAVVDADSLRLRDGPARDAELLATLTRGEYLLVTSDGAEADGFAWTRVMDLRGRIGWVARGDGTDEWLTDAGAPTYAAAALSFSSITDVVPPAELPQLTVLEDGTVIVADFLSDWEGFKVRRLTPPGYERFRSEILSSPLLTHAGVYEPVPRPDTGDQAPGHGMSIYAFTVGSGTDAFVVTSSSWFGDEEEAAFYLPSPERKELDALAQRLRQLRQHVADDEWADADARPYVAADFLLWVGERPDAAAPGAPPLPTVDLGIGPLDDFGAVMPRGRCGSIGLADALGIVWRLRLAGVDASAAGPIQAMIDLDGRPTAVFLSPRTPAGLPQCDDIFFAG